MDLRQLEYVVAIARTGSFTAAAADCHVSQSALSHQIARLETQLGVRLFNRRGRTVTPTEAGRLVERYAVRAVGEVDDMQTALAVLAGQASGRLRLGLTQTAERLFSLARHVAEFRQDNSAASVAVTIGPAHELVRAVAADQLDLAYAAAPDSPLPENVHFRVLVRDVPLVAVVAGDQPDTPQRSAFLAEVLAGHDLIEFAPPSALRKRTTQLLASGAGHRGAPGLALGSVPEMVRFAAAGIGVAVVPAVYVHDPALQAYDTPPRVVRLRDAGAALDFGVYRRGEGTSPVARVFAQLTTASLP